MVQMAPQRTAGSLLGLWAALTIFRTATGLTSDIACPTEILLCLGDSVCASCLETLRDGDISFDDVDSTECNTLYTDVCAVVEDAGCDITNSLLEDFAGCIAEEEFGCPDFTSCDVATGAATVAPTPTPVMTEAPTDMAAAMTMAPSSMASSVEDPEDAEDAEDAEDTRGANEDSGVSRTVAAAATRTAVAFAFGLALFLSV